MLFFFAFRIAEPHFTADNYTHQTSQFDSSSTFFGTLIWITICGDRFPYNFWFAV